MKPRRFLSHGNPLVLRDGLRRVHSSQLTYRELARRAGTTVTDLRLARRKLKEAGRL